MTSETRRKAVRDALAAWEEQEPRSRETYTLTVRGERRVLPVIQLRIAVPLLNPYSHRIRAQLQEDPEYPVVRDDPFGNAAQNILSRLVQERHRQFADLKASLRAEGQRDAGVIERSGVLVNANTRLVALRELASPERQQLRVALLPTDISSSQQDILEIETSLQVQRELKDPYSLANELLLVEELVKGDSSQTRSYSEIAQLMRYEGASSESPKDRRKADRQVQENLDLLGMIRRLCSLCPGTRIPITVFDAGESARERRQPLLEVLRRYNEFLEQEGIAVADQFAREWLIAFLGEAGAVHKARVIDPGWVDEYLLDELRDDERLPFAVDDLVAAPQAGRKVISPSLDLLADFEASPDLAESAAPRLLKLVADARFGDGAVDLPNGTKMEAAELRSVLTAAALAAIRAKERDNRDEKAAQAPIDHLRSARRSVKKATESFERAWRAEDFERNRFQLDLKRLKKDIELLERLLIRVAHSE